MSIGWTINVATGPLILEPEMHRTCFCPSSASHIRHSAFPSGSRASALADWNMRSYVSVGLASRHAKGLHASGTHILSFGNLGYGVSPGTLSICQIAWKRSSQVGYIEVCNWCRFKCKNFCTYSYSTTNKMPSNDNHRTDLEKDSMPLQVDDVEALEKDSKAALPAIGTDYSGATTKTDPEEIALVRKLDYRIMPALFCMYFL